MKKYYQPEKVAEMIPREPIPDEVRALYLRPGELLSIQDKCPIAFQPLGTLEWHGRHNPIGCDSIKAEQLCIETAKRLGGVVMPAIHFSNDAYRNIGKGQGMRIPVPDATAQEGEIRFDMQIDGLIRFAQEKLEVLLQTTCRVTEAKMKE